MNILYIYMYIYISYTGAPIKEQRVKVTARAVPASVAAVVDD